MVTKSENTAAVNATVQQEKYSPDNLMMYSISLALMKTLTDEGIFNESEYRKYAQNLPKAVAYLRLVYLQK